MPACRDLPSRDILFQLGFLRREWGLHLARTPGNVTRPGQSLHPAVIVFSPSPAAESNPQTDWATPSAECIPRKCPECSSDSIIGHGRRRKQAHDEDHDWISIRRGLCTQCWKTITFLPPFSLPYTHYSLTARSQALQRFFVDGCSLQLAVPLVKDPNRVPDVSTVRRWFCSLDSAERLVRLQQLHLDLPSAPTTKGSTDPSRPGISFPFLRKMMSAVVDCLARGGVFAYDPCVLSWRTLAHFLHVLLPLRC